MISPLPPAVILAGGAGRRMGGNKPLYVHEGRILIDAVIDRLAPQASRLFINPGPRNAPLAGALASTSLPLCLDAPETCDLGPLSGIHTALRTARETGGTAVITAPCDMPNLPHDMVARLLDGHDDTTDISHFSGARDYPLCALWNVSVLPALETALKQARDQGGLAVMAWLKTQKVRKIAAGDDTAFININQPTRNAPRS